MGFTGDFVVARSRRPLLELPVFHGMSCFRMCDPRADFWQTMQVSHGLDLHAPEPHGSDQLHGLLAALVEQTGAPAMIASVFDSDLCTVRGLAPGEDRAWSAYLAPELTALLGQQSDPAAEPVPVGWYLDQVPVSAYAIGRWSQAAGLSADGDRLTRVLVKRSVPFVEDLFSELLDAAGLPDFLAEGVDDGSYELIHPRHSAEIPWDNEEKIELAVLKMDRGNSLMLSCATANCSLRVWARPDGSYQLEYRDRAPDEHYQTRTLLQEKVIAAARAWALGDVEWRDNFQWTACP